MATDPPDRPTFAALQREHGGGQPPLVDGVRTEWSGDTRRLSHRRLVPPHSADFCFTCPRSMAASPTPHHFQPQPQEDDTGLPTRSYAQNPSSKLSVRCLPTPQTTHPRARESWRALPYSPLRALRFHRRTYCAIHRGGRQVHRVRGLVDAGAAQTLNILLGRPARASSHQARPVAFESWALQPIRLGDVSVVVGATHGRLRRNARGRRRRLAWLLGRHLWIWCLLGHSISVDDRESAGSSPGHIRKLGTPAHSAG